MKEPAIKFNIIKVENNHQVEKEDFLAVEEPLEIKLKVGENAGKNISITMRTPGHDENLAVGFLYTEGIIKNLEEVEKVGHLKSFNPKMQGNQIQVDIKDSEGINLQKLERHFYTSSSCGVCGKTSIEAVESVSQFDLHNYMTNCPAQLITQLPEKLRSAQSTFQTTGGLHAAALFDFDGNLVLLREDVGRHNALDKLIGAAFSKGMLPLKKYLVQLSGRASFELVQKSMMAGIPILSAIGAPSSLAIELGSSAGMAILGFVSKDRFNLYCGKEKLVF